MPFFRVIGTKIMLAYYTYIVLYIVIWLLSSILQLVQLRK